MTNSISFSLHSKKDQTLQTQDYCYLPGLHVIYGESGAGKTDFIKLLIGNDGNNSKHYTISKDFNNIDVNVIYQNPDLQIISNTIENELAFSLECSSNDTKYIEKKLNIVKNELLFSVDTNRHPVTLSGGEKELLNISTAFLLPSRLILIDDALSFLSDKLKSKVTQQYFTKKQSESVIIWFTSDESDLNYGETKWELTSQGLLEIDIKPLNEIPKRSIQKGKFALDIKNLDFSYDNKNPIFRNFSKYINNFRCLGIIGDNGSGKSTLASLLLELEKPISGSINLNYQDKNIDIGYLDQFPEKLLGIMTLREFVNILIKHGKIENNQLKNIISKLSSSNLYWEDINNSLALDLPWTTLRIALIIILLNCNYDLLILDEPTFGMGIQQKQELQSYLHKYLEEKHLILISHDHKFIGRICDSIIELQ